MNREGVKLTSFCDLLRETHKANTPATKPFLSLFLLPVCSLFLSFFSLQFSLISRDLSCLSSSLFWHQLIRRCDPPGLSEVNKLDLNNVGLNWPIHQVVIGTYRSQRQHSPVYMIISCLNNLIECKVLWSVLLLYRRHVAICHGSFTLLIFYSELSPICLLTFCLILCHFTCPITY